MLRALWAVLLLGFPRALLERLTGRHPGRGALLFARVLGLRQVLEWLVLRPGNRLAVALGAAVDALHGLTALALALARPRWRVAAGVNAVVALGFALEGVARARARPAEDNSATSPGEKG